MIPGSERLFKEKQEFKTSRRAPGRRNTRNKDKTEAYAGTKRTMTQVSADILEVDSTAWVAEDTGSWW